MRRGRRTLTQEKLGGEFHLGQSQGKYVGEAAADFGGEVTRKLVLGEDINLGEIRGRCVLLDGQGWILSTGTGLWAKTVDGGKTA